MNIEKIDEAWKYLDDNLSFMEQCKLFREICYDKISYWSEEHKGIIYNGEYSQKNIEQATSIQQQISTMIDLYSQIINGKREFEERYLKSKGVYGG